MLDPLSPTNFNSANLPDQTVQPYDQKNPIIQTKVGGPAIHYEQIVTQMKQNEGKKRKNFQEQITKESQKIRNSAKAIQILTFLALGALAILASIAITAGILILKNIIPIKNPLAQKITGIIIVVIGALALLGTLITSAVASCYCIINKLSNDFAKSSSS